MCLIFVNSTEFWMTTAKTITNIFFSSLFSKFFAVFHLYTSTLSSLFFLLKIRWWLNDINRSTSKIHIFLRSSFEIFCFYFVFTSLLPLLVFFGFFFFVMSSVYVCDQVLNTCSAQIHNPYDFFTLNWQQICSCEPKIVVQTLVVVNVIYIYVHCMHPSCCKCTMSQKWNEIALNLTIVASRHLTMNNILNVSMHMHKPRLLTEIYTNIDIFIFKIVFGEWTGVCAFVWSID